VKRIFALLLVVAVVLVACSPPDASKARDNQNKKLEKAAGDE
jgi:ABC-type enterochelin transport system substrate-binding protein